MIEKLAKEKAEQIIEKYKERIENKEGSHFNIFNIIEMRECSHTKFLAWLFDVKNKNKDDIQYDFLREFLLKYKYCNPDTIENLMSVLCEDISVSCEVMTFDINDQKNGNIDILLYSQKADFLIIIENKLDADICVRNGKTQIERYYNYITQCEKFKNYTNPKFFYTCIYSDELEEKYLRNIVLQTKSKDKVSYKDLLETFNYKVLEYSDIIQILDKILKKCNDNFIKELLSQYINYWEENEHFGGYTPIIDGCFVWEACKVLNIPYCELVNNK